MIEERAQDTNASPAMATAHEAAHDGRGGKKGHGHRRRKPEQRGLKGKESGHNDQENENKPSRGRSSHAFPSMRFA